MKKQRKLSFFYRYRLVIGYAALMLIFCLLLFILPTIAPNGLSEAEKQSALTASQIDQNFITNGQVINLPYVALQKASISLFGLSVYTIKLPSIIFAAAAAFFIVLLLNRWFKSDVAIIGSVFTTLSTAFLFLAGFGTPTILYIFWLALILWLGSKIVGNNHVPSLAIFSFVAGLALSVYTPHLAYVAVAIVLAGILHPHLRHSIKQLKIWQVIVSLLLGGGILAPLVIACIQQPDLIPQLLAKTSGGFATNISTAFAPFFSFSFAYDSIYLAPLFGLATLALVLIGALASVGSLFTSRNSVVSLLIIFAIIFSGLNPNIAISIIMPVAILSTAGLESIIEKWHTLFPENPYAHFFGTLPISLVVALILISGLVHFINGYHYTARVAQHFDNDLSIIRRELSSGDILLVAENNPDYDFYKLLESQHGITVQSQLPDINSNTVIASLHEPRLDDQLELERIITSPKSRNSARLYLYHQLSQ